MHSFVVLWKNLSRNEDIERYDYECAKYEAKHQCMLINNVHIILSSQLHSMQKEIQKIIGRQTLLSFRVKAKNIKN